MRYSISLNPPFSSSVLTLVRRKYVPNTSSSGISTAVAVGISLLYALTLAPALCAMILKFRDDSKRSLSQRVRRVYDASFHALLGR